MTEVSTEEIPASVLYGRERELDLLDRFLSEPSSPLVIFLSGPPGIGKSAITAEAQRRVKSVGGDVYGVSGRYEDPLGSLRGLTRSRGLQLAVVDDYEFLLEWEEELLSEVLPSLPGGIKVLIVGRVPPGPRWREGGWESVVLPVTVEPLDEVASRRLLAAHGVTESDAVDQLVGWARGEPLALVMAAHAASADPAFDPASPDSHRGLMDSLAKRLLRDELVRDPGPDRSEQVLRLVATAGGVDRELLSTVVPEDGVADAESWLTSLSFTRPHGMKVALDERVAQVLRAQLEIDGLEDASELPPWTRSQAPSIEVVWDALRSLHRPTDLAPNPLATGRSPDQRKSSVWQLMRQVVEDEFRENAGDNTLREVVEAAYFDPSSSHDAAARRLHLSRATYFRRLREAVERMADHLDRRGRDLG